MATYKIKDLEILTGIKAHTIRIWEKRYGILNPDRTDTKIRTYTDEELKLILNISILNNRGLKISKIADLTESQILNEVEKDKKESCSVQEKLLLSLINLDESLFHQTIDVLFNEIGVQKTFTNFVFPFLERTGVMWLVGTINPAQEHFISNLIREKIIVEISKLKVKNNEGSKKVILYLPEHDNHELSLLFYHYLLKMKGYQSYYLGQSLPLDSFLKSCEKIQPDLVITSWIASVDKKMLVDYFKQVKKHCSAPILAGGFQIISAKEELEGLVTFIQNDSFLDKI